MTEYPEIYRLTVVSIARMRDPSPAGLVCVWQRVFPREENFLPKMRDIWNDWHTLLTLSGIWFLQIWMFKEIKDFVDGILLELLILSSSGLNLAFHQAPRWCWYCLSADILIRKTSLLRLRFYSRPWPGNLDLNRFPQVLYRLSIKEGDSYPCPTAVT